jgi:hypothetical protein
MFDLSFFCFFYRQRKRCLRHCTNESLDFQTKKFIIRLFCISPLFFLSDDLSFYHRFWFLFLFRFPQRTLIRRFFVYRCLLFFLYIRIPWMLNLLVYATIFSSIFFHWFYSYYSLMDLYSEYIASWRLFSLSQCTSRPYFS